jgi:hypothetical protein
MTIGVLRDEIEDGSERGGHIGAGNSNLRSKNGCGG